MLEYIQTYAHQLALSLAVDFEHPIDNDTLDRITKESISRFIFQLFIDYKMDDDFFNNLHSYNESKHTYSDAQITSDFQRLQRTFARYNKLHKERMNYFRDRGLNPPDLMIKENNRRGRTLDLANLDLISIEHFDLVKYVNNRSIYDYKIISNSKLLKALEQYDSLYSEAKSISEKISLESDDDCKQKQQFEYITKWLHFQRMESCMLFSYYIQTSKYMKDNKKADSFIYDILPILLCHFFSIQIPNQGNSPDQIIDCGALPYQILSINSIIPKLFDKHDINDKHNIVEMIMTERAIEYILVNELISQFMDRYISYYEKNRKEEIGKIYSFCKDSYPIIESHTFDNFYLDKEKKIVNISQIKCLRKLYKKTLAPKDTQ